MDGKLKLRLRSCSSVPESITKSVPKETSESHDLSSFQRQQRNLAEKQRRDRFNSYIQELGNIVPMVSKAARRLDKISVLRLAAAHLRLHFSALNPKASKKVQAFPNFLKQNVHKIQAVLGGFLMVISCSGKIIFTSADVESFIGHQDIDLMGHSFYSYIQPSDIPLVRKQMDELIERSEEDSAPDSRVTFVANLREHCQPRSDAVSYRTMLFHCSLNTDTTSTKQEVGSHKIILDSTTLVKMFVRPADFNPLNELSLSEAFQDEYVTTHGLQGEILYADHRISTITGHLPNEVRGMSAYQYIYSQDVPVALFAQKLMFSSNSGTGIIVYRLRTRSDSFVYLQSTGFLEYKSSTEISHFVCYNKLLSDDEGSKELKKFQDRFLPLRTDTIQSLDVVPQKHSDSGAIPTSFPLQIQGPLQPTSYAAAETATESAYCCSGEMNSGNADRCATNGILNGFGVRNSSDVSEMMQLQVAQASSPPLEVAMPSRTCQVKQNTVLLNHNNMIDGVGYKRKYDAAFNNSTTNQAGNHLKTKKHCHSNGIHCPDVNEHDLDMPDAFGLELKRELISESSPNCSDTLIQDPFDSLLKQSVDAFFPDSYSNILLESDQMVSQNDSAQNGSLDPPTSGESSSNCDFDPFVDEFAYAVDENYYSCSRYYFDPTAQ